VIRRTSAVRAGSSMIHEPHRWMTATCASAIREKS
jgi:hypothetical protein